MLKNFTCLCMLVMFSLFLTGCVAGHKKFRSQVITDLSECSHTNVAYMVIDVDCERSTRIDKGGATNAFLVVEVDDFGEFHDAKQVTDTLHTVKTASFDGPTVLLTYIHGWRHNASESSSNLKDFRRLVFDLASNPCALNGIESNAASGNACNYKNVIGLYVGWRGDSWYVDDSSRNKLSWILQSLTFWNRLAASEDVAGTNVTKFLLKISDTLREGDRTRNEGSCLYIEFDMKEKRCSKSIVIGHSMGGRVLERTVAQAFIGGRHIAEGADVNGLIERNISDLDSFNQIKKNLEQQIRKSKMLAYDAELNIEQLNENIEKYEAAVARQNTTLSTLRSSENKIVPVDAKYAEELTKNASRLKKHLRMKADEKWVLFENYLCVLNAKLTGAFNSPIYIRELRTDLSTETGCSETLSGNELASIVLPDSFGENICELIDVFADIFDEASLDKKYSTFQSAQSEKCNIAAIHTQLQRYRSEIDSIKNNAFTTNISGFYNNFQKALVDFSEILPVIGEQIIKTASFRGVKIIGFQQTYENILEDIPRSNIAASTIEFGVLLEDADSSGYRVSTESVTFDQARGHLLEQRRDADTIALRRADYLTKIQKQQEIINKEQLKLADANKRADIDQLKLSTARETERLFEAQLDSSKTRFLGLASETELLFESVTKPPFDIALMINPATSALNSRMLKNALCDTRLELEKLGFEGYMRPPWIVSVSSVDDSATSKTFLLASTLENNSRVFQTPRNKKKGARVGPFSDCVGKLPDLTQAVLDKKPAPFISNFHTHYVGTLEAVGKVNQTCKYVPRSQVGIDSEIALGIADGAKIAIDKKRRNSGCDHPDRYLGSFKGINLILNEAKIATNLKNDDYWIFQVPARIIPDHNSIFTYEVGLLTSALLNHTQSHGSYCNNTQANMGLCRILKTKKALLENGEI